MIHRFHIISIILIAVIIAAIPASIHAAVTVNISFLNPRMQVFVVGDILKGDAIEQGGGIDLADFEEFFWLKINATPDQTNTKVYIRFWENLDDKKLIDYSSSSDPDEAFTLGKWMQESDDGAGTFANTDISTIEGSDWYTRDAGKTTFADVTTVLDNLEDGLFPTSTFTLGVEVFDLNGNLLATISRTIKVYNPAKPILSLPLDEKSFNDFSSIQFSWTWPSGGTTVGTDWNLVIVDAGTEKPADPESVISGKTAANTRYDRAPQLVTGHNYTGTGGGEAELQRGRWYCWQVTANAPATLANATRAYTSEVRTFSTIVDPTQIQGYSSILFNALMVDGGKITFIMDGIKDQFNGYVPVQVKHEQVSSGGDATGNATAISDQSAVDDIKDNNTYGGVRKKEVVGGS